MINMFLIGGIQPKTNFLAQESIQCPVCGENQARYQRVDHYLSLFFIPLLRVKKGQPFLMCAKCKKAMQEFDNPFQKTSEQSRTYCSKCQKTL